MVAIVTLIAQPFAQESLRTTFGLPEAEWLSVIVAVVVSGMLAIYKFGILRRSTLTECAICVPLSMFLIFSAYAGGNNAVYYAELGYTRGPESSEEWGALRRERDNLQQQLENAQSTVERFRRALGLPEVSGGKRHPSTSSLIGLLRSLAASEASAQEPRPPSGQPRREELNVQELREVLKSYQQQQRELSEELQEIKREQKKARKTQQRPLIKSW